jgi:hypothetical protein
MLLLFSTFYTYDYFLFSRNESFVALRYLFEDEKVNVSLFEKYHHKIMMIWGEAIGIDTDFKKQLEKKYDFKRIVRGPRVCKDNQECKHYDEKELNSFLEKNQECLKQLFLGGSQTIGAGASSYNKTFVKLIHNKKYANISKKRCLLTINLSVSGWPLEKISNYYIKNFSNHKFDIIVLNTGVNNKEDTLLDPYQSFLKYSREQALNLVILEEAISPDFYFFQSGLKHLIINREAEKLNFKTYSLADYMKKETLKREGDIWWDMAHYTDYGHQLVADWLSEKMDNHYDYGQDKAL